MQFNPPFKLLNPAEKHAGSEFIADQIDGRKNEVKDARVIKDSLAKLLHGEPIATSVQEVVAQPDYQPRIDVTTIEAKPTDYQPATFVQSSEQATFISESQAAVQAALQK